VSRLGVPATTTSTIVSRGILPPGISDQTTNVVQSTITTSISSSTPLIIGSTQPLSVASLSLPLVSNAFTFGMSLFGMQSMLVVSQPTPQVSSVGVGSFLIPNKVIPWGGGNISSSNPSLGVCVFSLRS